MEGSTTIRRGRNAARSAGDHEPEAYRFAKVCGSHRGDRRFQAGEFRPAGIEGWAKIYGHNTISIDEEDDPYAYGFQVL